MYLMEREIDYLEKEIIKLTQENLSLKKLVAEYKILIKELKKHYIEEPDSSDGEASDFYDDEY